MSKPLTVADRSNARAIALRIVDGMFDPRNPFVRDGKLHDIDHEMLLALVEQAVRLGWDCAKACAKESA